MVTTLPQAEARAAPGELARLAAIARVAAAKGWGHYAEQLGFAAQPTRGGGAKADGERLREALEELGPTFVKFGQMMASRTDLLPEHLTGELRKLHDRVSPFPGAQARRIVEAETGRPLGELFEAFDDEPLAAASIAQVHLAVLHGGQPVVVKVQRPGIAGTLEADIAVLQTLAGLLGRAWPALRPLNLPELVEEFARTLREELDFEREARNAERFAATNEDEPQVVVPRIFRPGTTKRVLTMEYAPGERLDRSPDPAARAASADLLMRLFLAQVFEHGVFHADPHPGNVLVTPDGRLCFLDFGALGELSPALQESLRQMFLAVLARDASWMASAYLGLGGAAGELDRGAFQRDLARAMDDYHRGAAGGRRSLSAILQAFVRLGREHHIRLVREVALLLRAFAELEALVHELDPKFHSLEVFRAYSPRLLKRAFKPRLGLSDAAALYRAARSAGELGRDLPVALRRILGRLERGEALFDIRHQSGGSLERHLLHASNRLAFALIVAATIVGSAIVIAAGPDLQLLGVLGFVVAGVLGAAWAILALRSGRL